MTRFWLGLMLLASLAAPQGLPPQRDHQATLTILDGVGADRTLRLSGEVRVRVEVVGTAPLTVQMDDPLGDANWAVRAGKPTQTVTGADGKQATWRRELVFEPLQPGEHVLAVPALRYKEDDGDWVDVAWKQRPALRVLTQVGKPDVDESRDITDIEPLPPVEPAAAPWPWLAAAGAAVLLAAAAWLVLRRRRAPAPPPDRVALCELERLARQQPATAAEAERHHRELAEVLRQYLEQRFRLPAQRRTSAELAAELRQADVLTQEQQTLLVDVLARCDLAKFAALAEPAACAALVSQARALVEQTAVERPAVVSAGSAPAGRASTPPSWR